MKNIDLHVHFREEPEKYAKELKKYGVEFAAPMANTKFCLDNLAKVLQYNQKIKSIKPLPISSITKKRAGKQLVNIKKIKPYVIGFSDDGNCLKNLKLLEQALNYDVMIIAHLEPETEMLEGYISTLAKMSKCGYLYFQHISKKESINLIRKAKNSKLNIFAETCPQYFAFNKEFEDIKVNPPIGDEKDNEAILKGLKDGIIDVIASDFAPMPRPRKTGFASYPTFIALCNWLVSSNILTQKQLEDKLYNNPKKIIKLSNPKFKI